MINSGLTKLLISELKGKEVNICHKAKDLQYFLRTYEDLYFITDLIV